MDKRSNHPAYILNQVPKTINQRLNELSKSKYAFEKSRDIYQAALDKSMYKHKLVYSEEKKKRKRQRRRKIVYYQPPFCRTVATNICKSFMGLVSKHFPKGHRYEKIFNKNKIRVSYCCMPNVKNIITAHNNRILRKYGENLKKTKECNCRRKNECPVENKCLQENVIYRANITSSKGEKTYVGSTGNTFKERYGGHKASFNKKGDKNKTELAKYVWELKDNGIKFELTWEILHKAGRKYNSKHGCNLCNLEKIEILKADKNVSLNKRKELQTKCPHYRKMFLDKPPDDGVVK